jgi:hypothetical protein
VKLTAYARSAAFLCDRRQDLKVGRWEPVAKRNAARTTVTIIAAQQHLRAAWLDRRAPAVSPSTARLRATTEQTRPANPRGRKKNNVHRAAHHR